MTLATAIGTLGATITLVAFVLNQINVWSRDGLPYDLANTLGGLLLVTYALMLGSIPFALLNGVWFAVSLRDVVYDIVAQPRKKSRASAPKRTTW